MAYTRLVSARRGAAQTLLFPALMVVVLVATLSAVPWSLRNPDLARTYIAPNVKVVFVIVGALSAFGFLVFAVVQIAVGFGLLASPWGILGHPRQRLTVRPGEVAVRLVGEPPAVQVYGYGVQRLHLTQADSTLHIVSYVKYNVASRKRLSDWLTAQGVTPVFDGDPDVLPSR